MPVKDNLAKSGNSKSTIDGIKMNGKVSLVSQTRIKTALKGLPFNFKNGSAVIYNGKLHAIAVESNKAHLYSYDGFVWMLDATFDTSATTAFLLTVFENKLHIVGGSSTEHFTWDGNVIQTISDDIGKRFVSGSSMVYKSELHIFGLVAGSGIVHYIYDGIAWRFGAVPSVFSKRSTVDIAEFNFNIYVYLNMTSLYIYNGVDWSTEDDLPSCPDGTRMIKVGDNLHLFGVSSKNPTLHYKKGLEVGSTWELEQPIPTSLYNSCIIPYENAVAVLGGSDDTRFEVLSMESFDGQLSMDLTKLGELPYSGFNGGSAIEFNHELHILGSDITGNDNKHYKYTGSEWVLVSELPEAAHNATLVVYFDKLYLVGTGSNIYSFDDASNTWKKTMSAPIDMNGGVAFTYDKYLHIMNGTSHYKFFAGSWTKLTDIPVTISNAQDKVVRIGESALLFWGDDIYNYDLTDCDEWIRIGETITSSENAIYAVSKSVIHCFTGTDHYTTTLANLSDFKTKRPLTVTTADSKIVEFVDQLVMVGSGQNDKFWYSIPENDWVREADVAVNFMDAVQVTYHGKLHIFGGTGYPSAHIAYDGTSWEVLDGIPYSDTGKVAVVYEDMIHLMGGTTTTGSTTHITWTESDGWKTETSLPYSFVNGSAVVHQGVLHIMGSSTLNCGTKHYKLNGSSWVSVGTLPYTFYNGEAISYHNEIHIFGSKADSASAKMHQKWDGVSWTSVDKIPYEFYEGSSFICDNRVFLVGSAENLTYATYVYSWDEDGFVEHVQLPYTFANGLCTFYKSKIHVVSTSLNTSNSNSHYTIIPCVQISKFDSNHIVQKQGDVAKMGNAVNHIDDWFLAFPALEFQNRKSFIYCKRTPIGPIPLTNIQIDVKLTKWSYVLWFDDKVWIFVDKTKTEFDPTTEDAVYTWDGYSLERQYIDFPDSMSHQNPIVYNGYINIFTRSGRYLVKDGSLVRQYTLPYTHPTVDDASIYCVLNGVIHMFGGGNIGMRDSHSVLTRNGVKYSWASLDNLPVELTSGAEIWGNEDTLIISDGNSRYRYNGGKYMHISDDSIGYHNNGVVVSHGIPITLGRSESDIEKNYFMPVPSYNINLWN